MCWKVGTNRNHEASVIKKLGVGKGEKPNNWEQFLNVYGSELGVSGDKIAI